jgi:hypothetical protein
MFTAGSSLSSSTIRATRLRAIAAITSSCHRRGMARVVRHPDVPLEESRLLHLEFPLNRNTHSSLDSGVDLSSKMTR